jgi:hypothetical protein
MVVVFTNKIFKGRIYFRSARWDTNDDAPKPLTRDEAREVLERRIPRRVQFNLQLRNLLRENFIISIEERKIAYGAPQTILSFTVRNVCRPKQVKYFSVDITSSAGSSQASLVEILKPRPH